jgi:hypothetical protein
LHVPWLRSQLLGAVEAYAHGMKVDMSGIEQMASGFDPASLMDPSKMEELLSQGMFEPKATPEQTAALERLETMLALIEGWVATVVSAALGERIPGTVAFSEMLRRRRGTGGPAEQTFATLLGLELRPRKMREAAVLWERLTEAAGMDARDAVLQSKITLDADKKTILVRYWDVERKGSPPVEGVVRVPSMKGFYKLEQLDDKLTRVTYQGEAEPGGNVPDWIVARASRNIPLLTIKNLRAQTVKTQGQYEDFVTHWDPKRGEGAIGF